MKNDPRREIANYIDEVYIGLPWLSKRQKCQPLWSYLFHGIYLHEVNLEYASNYVQTVLTYGA